MSMRMAPAVAQQSALPDINRAGLVFFGGLALIVLNVIWNNGPNLYHAIFTKGATPENTGIGTDQGLQLVGLGLLTLMAQYGGEGAGSVALVLVAAMWLLWLVEHRGSTPGKPATSTPTTPALGAVPGASLLTQLGWLKPAPKK